MRTKIEFARFIARIDPESDSTVFILEAHDMTKAVTLILPSLRRPLLRLLLVFTVLTTWGAPRSASAEKIGSNGGTWTTVFATTKGNCSSGYSVPFLVTGNRVSSAGGGRVSGSVNRGGAVTVQVSVGASKASGAGRLAGNSGAGYWRGIITGDRCSGTWQATRN